MTQSVKTGINLVYDRRRVLLIGSYTLPAGLAGNQNSRWSISQTLGSRFPWSKLAVEIPRSVA